MTKAAEQQPEPTGVALLRRPFPDHHISKLPKETKQQIDERKAGKNAIRCTVCGGWHHKNAVHLDYVGHAALTDRLLDADPAWAWEPVAFNQSGLPALDGNGGLWIRLTVDGVSRLGYGHADGKSGGDAIKEAIGDALRNAAMRFGAALDLWHKGDLHAPADEDGDDKRPVGNAVLDFAIGTMRTCRDLGELGDFWTKNAKGLKEQLSAEDFATVEKAKDAEKSRLAEAAESTPFDKAA